MNRTYGMHGMNTPRMNTPRTNLTTIFEDIALPDNNVFKIGQVVQFKKHPNEEVYKHLGVITHMIIQMRTTQENTL
jgi:ribosomal protein S8E